MSIKDYCRDKAAPSGSNFYYSTLFQPQSSKHNLHTLHAFGAEIINVIEECSDPGVARMKLQWWHEEVQRSFSEQARHPVGKSLANLIADHPVNEEKFHQFILYAEQKLNLRQPGDYGELDNILRRGPGVLWRLSADLCGYRDQKTPDHTENIGCSIALFEIIQNSYRDALHGRLLLAREDMENAGITLSDLINTDSKKAREFLVYQIQRLVNQLDNSYAQFPDLDSYIQLPHLIMNRLIVQTCKEIELDGYNLSKYKITLTPLRKLWIAWRTKLGTKRSS